MIKYPVSRPCLTAADRHSVMAALEHCQLTQGVNVRRFEGELALRLGVPHVVATTSGTTALHLALAALGLGPGDEVIVPDLTYVATANAVAYTRARVRLADIDPATGCLDVEDVARKITGRTRAIIPVHLYGVPCDMETLFRLAGPDIHIIEDAAEGFGGTYWTHSGAPMGTLGTCGTFSFYGNKIMTTGEGGAVVTRDPALADRLRSLRGMAQDPKQRYFHTELGFNYRMTDLQAALGFGQLSHLTEMLTKRTQICDRYSQRVLGRSWPAGHAPWLFTFLLPEGCPRDVFMARLDEQGIETRPAFVPLHRMPMFRTGSDRDFPGATFFGDQGVSLPTYPELSLNDVDIICNEVWRVLSA